ncbi:uncharacterized protein RJT21DRAFT_54872 [Scheffersomyces amazonensis]|uniref:uncharacterized protein n=1 Tax=Scheffersomyces amazonensis TaxID=1078765 RepID=UPI00315DD9BE
MNISSLLSPKKILGKKDKNSSSSNSSKSPNVAALTAASKAAASSNKSLPNSTSSSASTTLTSNTTTSSSSNSSNGKPHHILSPPRLRDSTTIATSTSPEFGSRPQPPPSSLAQAFRDANNLPTNSNSPNSNSLSSLPRLDVKIPSGQFSESSSLYGSSPTSPVQQGNPSLSPFRAPRLNYSNDSNSILSGSQSQRRNLSDKIKTTPSSFVRQSRIYSSPDFNNSATASIPSLNSLTGKSLLLQNKLETDNLSPELVPIVNLINAHKLRTYAVGNFSIPAVLGDQETAWLEVEAKLSGNELAIWRPAVFLDDDEEEIVSEIDEFKPKYINLIDSRVEIGHDFQIQIISDFQHDNALLIKFFSEDDFIKWIAAIQLSKFEYNSLSESFTASILSNKGAKLSDLHVLLSSKKRFPKYEWCNVRFPQINSKYLKVYIAILPSDNKKLGRIEIYSTDKISNKNLIAYINQVDNIFNVYPEHSSMIDINSIMKLNGEIFVNKNFEYLFYHEQTPSSNTNHGIPSSSTSSSLTLPIPFSMKNGASSPKPSRVGSHTSLSSVTYAPPKSPTPPASHSRNVSVNSATSSFFNYAPSPKLDDVNISPKKPVNNRNRSVSSPAKIFGTFTNSNSNSNTPTTSTNPLSNNTTSTSLNSTKSSTSAFFKKHINNFVQANCVYIIPTTHPGVNPVETMIRNFIPIIDAFRLYGRPDHLNSDKTNPNSLLFGLPSLPRYQYLSDTDAQIIVDKNLEKVNEDWTDETWRKTFKSFISAKYLKSSVSSKFQGYGNIHDLYSELDLNLEAISSPTILLPKTDSVESGDSFSDIINVINTPPSRVASPLAAAPAINNSNYLGEPIQLPTRHVSSPLSSVHHRYEDEEQQQQEQSHPQPINKSSGNNNIHNLRLNGEDDYNAGRSLDPIVDLPTPLDELHAYPNLVNLDLRSDNAA